MPGALRAFAVLSLLACAVYAVPSSESVEAVGDLMSLAQERSGSSPPQVAHYTREQFAVLMNKIIMKASKMRDVMNKLGISDTESVRQVEQHFIHLGEEQEDLGDGMVSQEDLRLQGLQARECVKHASSCSRMAAGCPMGPKRCDRVVKHCSHAAAACGIGESKATKKKLAKTAAKAAEKVAVDTDMEEHAAHEEAEHQEQARQIHEQAMKETEEVYDEAAEKLDAKVAAAVGKPVEEEEELDEETESLDKDLEMAESDMEDTLSDL